MTGSIRHIVIVAIVALAATACSGAGSTSTAAADAATAGMVIEPDASSTAVIGGITVSGRGVAAGTPDVVRVSVGVGVERDSVETALADANAATEDVLEALAAAGIDEADRQTQRFSLHPTYERGGGAISGYRVSNTVEATVRDIDQVGTVLAEAVAAGGDAARVQGVRFDLEDDGPQVRAARAAAIEDARATAAHYAELAGVELGEPIGIQDLTVSSPLRADAVGDGAAAQGADAAAVPIEPGTQDVVVSVSVRWAVD